MMDSEFKKLNRFRKGAYKKDESQEKFLEEFNNYLLKKELDEYRTYPINHPFLFVIGPPRSGTTLLSQLIANTFDISYINNLAARFFLAPLHGIRFSESVIGSNKSSDFSSNYARTSNLSDIHEFGYFWRYWLNKHTFDDITFAKSRENEIEWFKVRDILSTLQFETNKPFVFKNIYGSYHMKKFAEILDKVIFIYIERDDLDTAVSILNARKKYNSDLNVWWSYQPPEYNELKNENYQTQIAGQVHFLKKYYTREMEDLDDKNKLRITYNELCKAPELIIKKIINTCEKNWNYQFNMMNTPPAEFPFRTYENSADEKQTFAKIFSNFKNQPD